KATRTHRLRSVGSSRSGAALTRRSTVSGGGSSRVLRKAFCAWGFIASAGRRSTTFRGGSSRARAAGEPLLKAPHLVHADLPGGHVVEVAPGGELAADRLLLRHQPEHVGMVEPRHPDTDRALSPAGQR